MSNEIPQTPAGKMAVLETLQDALHCVPGSQDATRCRTCGQTMSETFQVYAPIPGGVKDVATARVCPGAPIAPEPLTPYLSTEIIRFAMMLAGRTADGVGVHSITLAMPLYRKLAGEAALRGTYGAGGASRLEVCTPVGPVVILEGE